MILNLSIWIIVATSKTVKNVFFCAQVVILVSAFILVDAIPLWLYAKKSHVCILSRMH